MTSRSCSTSYRYATGLAAQGCGLTVPFGDDDALADALARALIGDELRRWMARGPKRCGGEVVAAARPS